MNAADNPTIIITMIASLCVYIMLLIWGRFKDKEDLTKLGASPLPDNDPRDKYLYEIMVFTGGKEDSSTKSRVQFIISGEKGETDVRTFEDPRRSIFKRNAIDIFVLAVPESLGNLQFLRVWHDNTGKGKDASWYLRYIIFRDVQTGQKFEFISNQWFAVEMDDGQIDRLIAVAGDAQKKEFGHLFDSTSHKNLYDGHLWFSVFLRPARSRFTRLQRLTACMALLYLSMVTNAMFYGVIPEEPGAGGLSIGPFSVSPAAIGVGIVSNLITFPPTLLIIQLFRKASPKFKRVSRIQKAMERQREEKRREFEEKRKSNHRNSFNPESGEENEDIPRTNSGRPLREPPPQIQRKKPKSLPWWTLYIAWFVAIASILAGGLFTFFYGVSFGEEKTKKWLGALLVSFFSSVLLTQPLKVFLMAIIFSAICKKPVDDDDDADFDERDPVLGEDEAWMHELGGGSRMKKKMEYKPVNEKQLQAARVQRQKEIQMWEVIYDLGGYAFFLWIILILSHGNRDPNSFLLKKGLNNHFVLNPLISKNTTRNLYMVDNPEDLYIWLREVYVKEILMEENYNGKFNSKHDSKTLLKDQVSLLMGYSALRQIRIKERTCRTPKLVSTYITKTCRAKSSLIDEENEDFDIGWKSLAPKAKPKEEYTHRGALEIQGTPLWGNVDVYSGAGYQVILKGSKESMLATFDRLEKNRWIDERTRAVFVEFSIYNAQVNLFAACRICFEQGPEGGIHPYVRLNPIKLLRYCEGFALFVMICEGLFIVFIVFYTYQEAKDMWRNKRKYFDDPWNHLELIVIGLGWSAIVVYGIRTALGVMIVNKFKETNGGGYIRLDYAVSIDEIFLYIVSFLVFFATLKFIKLLRFNKRMGMLTSTLKQCASDLSGFILAFALTFLAFAQLFFLLFNVNNLDFTTFMTSVESTFSAMLGVFDFDGIYQSNPMLGPVFFFIFAFFTGLIMINLLLTLVIRSFQEIKHDLQKQSNEYEIVEFIVNKVKMAVGLAPKVKDVPLSATTEEVTDKNDKTAEFPEKVDQLLDYINEFYFESKLDFNDKEWLKKMSLRNRDPASGRPRTNSGENPVWHGRVDSGNGSRSRKSTTKSTARSKRHSTIDELDNL